MRLPFRTGKRGARHASPAFPEAMAAQVRQAPDQHVVDHAQAFVGSGQALQLLARAVVALAVGDDQLNRPALGHALRQCRVAEGRDVVTVEGSSP